MKRFIVIDFETTGGSPRQGDQIIQIGAVAIDDGQIVDTFSTFVNPGQPIPAYITQLTGITDEMVADAPLMEDVLPRLLRMLDGRAFVAHNASFDLMFLQEALLNQGYYTFDGPVLDTVELARFLLPTQGSYRLVELADDFDIVHDRPHQADSDALATAELFLHLLDILRNLPLVTIQRLQMLVASFRSDIDLLLRDLEQEKLASVSFEQEDGSEEWDIYRRLALRNTGRETHFPPAVANTDRPAFEPILERLLRPETLSGHVTGYQQRPMQEEMMRAVFAAMEEGQHLLVEAGTGTGKSLGYLLPSLVWAKRHGEQVVVSTHTITLQEQLFDKEIPTLRETLPFHFTAAKLKGRGNYLCLRKFEGSLEEPASEDSQELKLLKAQLVIWLTQTATGDVEELSLPPAGTLYWQQVKSDVHSCLNRQCPWFSRCYYFRAREAARKADLVIANHALLVNDMQTEHRILPSYQTVVIDEAHHLEEVAIQHLGTQYSTVQLQFLLDRLQHEAEGTFRPYVDQLTEWRPEPAAEARQKLSWLCKQWQPLQDDLQQWSRLLSNWALKRGDEMADMGRVAVRYTRESFAGRQNEKIITVTGRLIQRLTDYAQVLAELLAFGKAQEDTQPFPLRSMITDLNGLLDDVLAAANRLHELLIHDDPETVYWLETESRASRKHVYLNAAPLGVADQLAQLFAEKRSVVMTSATLTVKNSFAYIKETIGLDRLPEDRVKAIALPSPFDYEKQGMILIPREFPALKKDGEGEAAFLEAVIQGCVDVIRAAQGRTMILFTSHAMLKQVYQGVKELVSGEVFTLLGHGIDSNNRSKLVRKFQREPKAVLFGTSSFWEGVDIPGEALSALVIVRLPFAPPNHPVWAGRADQLKKQGRNPFMSLSLPQAVIQFKQGVGRLIRRQDDRGVIVVFDTRIIESRYGRAFLQSLPPFRVEADPWPMLREKIQPFLQGMDAALDTYI